MRLVELVMKYNGAGYDTRLSRKVLWMARIRHIRTGPYTPAANDKAECFIQTLLRGRADVIPFSS
jgi:transposase InsO family protein